VRDDADQLLPRRHFLGCELARQLLEQQQAMRTGVEEKASLREVMPTREAF